MSYTENIAELFVESANDNRDKIAIIQANDNSSITFSELNKRSDTYVDYFIREGVVAGEIVILMVKPSIDFICLTLALFKLGTPVVLIDPGMGFKNLLRCIERVGPDYLVGIPKALLFSRLFPQPFATVKKRFCCGKSFSIFGPDISEIKTHVNAKHQVYRPEKDDLAAIIFTTGSTGPPKGVRYEHSIFSAQLQLIKTHYDIGAKDTDQPAFPLFALFSTALGASAIIPDMDPTRPASVDPEKFVSSLLRYNVTYSFGSPAIWRVVGNYCRNKKIELPLLEKVLMAGAPVPYDLLDCMDDILPAHGRVMTPYGATESLPVASIDHREILAETIEQSRVGSGTCVGCSLPGITIRIIEISDKEIENISACNFLSPHIMGEIIVQGGVVTRSYMNNDPETRLAKIKDGETFWHRMGDVGYLDDKGRLWFCGRRAHRVVTQSQTYFSIPCEAIVNEHPDVYRSALVGVQNSDSRTLPVLVLEPNAEFKGNDKQLIEETKRLAEKSDITSNITHFLTHKSFPVDIRHNAKIFREKLGIWAQKKMYH